MSDREGETLANMAARTRGARGARLMSRGADNQPAERAPDAPTTQADIAGICQVVAQLIQQQAQTAPRPTLSMESYYERFRRLNPPLFEGGSDPMAAETWIREMEKMFDALQYPENVKVRLAIPMLKGNTEFWWTAIKAAYGNNDDQLTWEEFKEIFYDQYFPGTMRLVKENEFLALKQKDDMTVLEYANKFNELGRFCPQLMEFERSKANRFEQGLRYGIRSRLSSHIFNNYKDVLERALKVESELKRAELERGDKKRPRSAGNLKVKSPAYYSNETFAVHVMVAAVPPYLKSPAYYSNETFAVHVMVAAVPPYRMYALAAKCRTPEAATRNAPQTNSVAK
ncbi:uncharacterized protein [Elaeis guineensis]|uniref:uncharacterized protein n=1 Tax=Elaeis guineensis var. tenera TaxID=51953 RepID=UPI003C6CDE09